MEISEPQGDLDPSLGHIFAACVGIVVTTFTSFHVDACPRGGSTIVGYPVRVDLGS